METKNYIEIISENGDIKKYELITKIESERDNKMYFIMTDDEEIRDEVNIIIGYSILDDEEDSEICMVSDDEELDYVKKLIDKVAGDANEI